MANLLSVSQPIHFMRKSLSYDEDVFPLIALMMTWALAVDIALDSDAGSKGGSSLVSSLD